MNTRDDVWSEDHSTNDTTTPRVWLVRSGRAKKAFIARALDWAEDGENALRSANLATRAAALELQAQELELTHVSAVLKTLGQFLLATSRLPMKPQSAQEPSALPGAASRALSLLLLRVYLTGTDAGSAAEVEHLERSLASYLGKVSTTPRPAGDYN